MGHAYDVGVMVIFLFQMVFMDTALTIVTGRVCGTLEVPDLLPYPPPHGCVHLSIVRQLGMGRRLAIAARHQPGTRQGLLRLRRVRRCTRGGRYHGTRRGAHHWASHR